MSDCRMAYAPFGLAAAVSMIVLAPVRRLAVLGKVPGMLDVAPVVVPDGDP